MKVSHLALDAIDAPMLVAAADTAEVLHANEAARVLLQRVAPNLERVPDSLLELLKDAPDGQAVVWRPISRSRIGCTRYSVGDSLVLLLMKEISRKHAESSQKLHRERLEAIGRLVASIAHDLRNTVACIVYNTDLLAMGEMPDHIREETFGEIRHASESLQTTVDHLLDYARLGPTVSRPVSLSEMLTRASGFLRRYYRDGAHRLSISIPPEADTVRGNGLVIEQVFVNLLLNAAQAAEEPITVAISGERAGALVRIRIEDDGPGIADGLSSSVFDPFMTTRDDGTGLGLTNARGAVETLGGSLELAPSDTGAAFVIHLPHAEGGERGS